MAEITVGELLVRCLRAEGIELVTGRLRSPYGRSRLRSPGELSLRTLPDVECRRSSSYAHLRITLDEGSQRVLP